MTGFAVLIGWLSIGFAGAGAHLYRGLLCLCGSAAIGVGLFWLFG
jgi:hypothetical protein